MFSPLAARDFRRYYLGQTASSFGDSLTPLAIAFAVLHLTGSPIDLGIVVLSTRLPIVLLTLLGGAAGDRFSRRTIMLVTDLVRFGAHGTTAVLLLTGTAQLWMLVVLQLLAGVGSAFFNPAAVGLVTSLVGRESLQAANSLISISRSTASILALGAAGALVALVGPGWAILVDALTFLVSAAFLHRLPRAVAAERPGSTGGLLASIGDGLSQVGRRTWLWVWIVHIAVGNALVISPILVLGPYVADQHLGGAPAWSAIGIAYAAGGLAAGVISAHWRPARPMVAALLVFLLIAPLPALLALPASVWQLTIAGIAAGAELVLYNVIQTTAVQRHLPEEFVARATSVSMLGALVAAPLGMGLAGPAAAFFGTRPVLIAGAATAVLITAVTLLVPAVWRIRDTPTSPTAEKR
ncbi:Predicted arabinose efflux permease, MFS family [Nonomuraea maritima]|uniref:Predicted arabinose efflux permease, MFS family n=1 Tax=Nonomuraea maritima TaxID=683260 RepID=A0A1G9R9K3_9ACTN|nr:MFS transporter [Nonomuraea maritima]SDM19913.1 Predicted arabinose efflux permease, MFS family [Nonomuraea maritima]